MSKVPIDRELLERMIQLDSLGLCAQQEYAALRAILAQPAEAEGGTDLKPILEDVEREYEMGGLSDGLYADYASDVAKRYASAALSAVTAERDRLLAFVTECAGTAGGMVNGNKLSNRAKEVIAALAAKEA